MRTGLGFDKPLTASHMQTKTGRLLLLNSAAAEGYALESWDVPREFKNALSHPRFLVTMKKPPMADGS